VQDELGKLLARNDRAGGFARRGLAGKLAVNLVQHAFQRAEAFGVEGIPQLSHVTCSILWLSKPVEAQLAGHVCTLAYLRPTICPKDTGER
jgi:hypothetical protein